MVKRSIWHLKAARKERDQAIQILKAARDETELLNSVHPKQRTESSATVVVAFPHKDHCTSLLQYAQKVVLCFSVSWVFMHFL